MKHSKDEERLKAVESIIAELQQQPLVVVEGRHDVETLRQLQIRAQTYERVMRSGLPLPERAALLTDNDRRGQQKAELAGSMLRENGVKVDDFTGTRLLKILGVPHVESILQPIREAQDRATNRKTTRKQIGEIYGENILGHSKVHGRGKVQHQRDGGQA